MLLTLATRVSVTLKNRKSDVTNGRHWRASQGKPSGDKVFNAYHQTASETITSRGTQATKTYVLLGGWEAGASNWRPLLVRRKYQKGLARDWDWRWRWVEEIWLSEWQKNRQEFEENRFQTWSSKTAVSKLNCLNLKLDANDPTLH